MSRHQAYIVAQVAPHKGGKTRYQCIGALHQQGSYDSLPLTAALRFCTLIKQPENSEVIREELCTMDKRENQRNGDDYIPCPFTQFLFISAWGVDLDPMNLYSDHYVSNLSADTTPTSCENDNGITVVDITDPEKPTYCFFTDIYCSELVPESAEQYINAYCEDRGHLEESLIRSFDAMQVISEDVVDETWSMPQTRSSETKLETKTPKQETPSLVELTLKPAVKRAIAENDTDVLDFILIDSSRMDIAKDIIRSQNPISDGAFALLQNLVSVQKDKIFDLSGFHLSGKQIVNLLALYKGSEVTALKLSHNTSLKIGDLEQILQTIPKNFRRLLLFDTGITDTEIVVLLHTKPTLFYQFESIIHPAFLSGFYEKEPAVAEFSPSFTHMVFSRHKYPWGVSIPYFTPNTLAQGLTDYLSPIRVVDTRYDDYNLEANITAMAAYASSSRISETWGERSVAYIPRDEAGDAKHLRKGTWVFFFAYDLEGSQGNKCVYAFIRANKKGEEFLSDHGPKTKTRDILLSPDLFDIFDVRDFFKELELERRPSPDPKVLEKLFALFTIGGDDGLLSFISHDRIIEILSLPHY